MTSQPGQQTIVIHIFSNISRSKGNETMKFDQLINTIRETFFLKLVPNPFLKNLI